MSQSTKIIAGDAEYTPWVWLDAFGGCVRARDYVGARKLFVRDAHGFGTVVITAKTRARLERMQWARVWPVTSGFRFERAGARVLMSGDQTQATVMVTWKACNRAAPEKLVFDRRGRATIVLTRKVAGDPWRAEHTHFSFNPESSLKMSQDS
jgi:hypothetical protein